MGKVKEYYHEAIEAGMQDIPKAFERSHYAPDMQALIIQLCKKAGIRITCMHKVVNSTYLERIQYEYKDKFGTIVIDTKINAEQIPADIIIHAGLGKVFN